MGEISPIQCRRVEARTIINVESSNACCSFEIPVNVKLSHRARTEAELAHGVILAGDWQRNAKGMITC